MSINIIAGLI